MWGTSSGVRAEHLSPRSAKVDSSDICEVVWYFNNNMNISRAMCFCAVLMSYAKCVLSILRSIYSKFGEELQPHSRCLMGE